MTKSQNVRVLYIEDEQSLRELFRLSLEAHDFGVDVAETGAEGIELYNTGSHDLVVIDYQLPDMTGIEVGRKLLAITADLPMVIITGEGSEHLVIEAFTTGFSNYVVKDDASVYLELLPGVLKSLLKTVRQTRQRIEAEKALFEKEQQLRAIFDSTSTGVVSLNSEGTVVMANPAMLNMFGYSAQDLVGANIAILSPQNPGAETTATFEASIREITNEAGGIGKDVERRHKDGTIIPVHLVVSKSEVAGELYYTGIVTDLTERLKAERTRRLLEIGLDNIDQALALFDKNDTLIYCNHKFTLTPNGRVRPEIVPGVKIEEIVRGAVESNSFKIETGDKESLIKQILDRHQLSDSDVEVETANGTWLRYRKLKTTNDGLVLLREDITEQKNAIDKTRLQNEELERRVQQRTDELVEKIEIQKRVEAALKLSENRIRTIVESVNDGIFTIDEDNTIESFNSGAMAMFGYSLDEVIGKNFQDFIAAPVQQERRQAPRNNSTDRRKSALNRPYQETRAIRKDGTIFPIELTINELDLGEKQRYVGTIRDLTERRAEEQARREIEARFKSVVDSSPSAILIKDLNGRFLSANTQWHAWFNPERRSILEMSLSDIFTGDVLTILEKTDLEVVSTAKPTAFEITRNIADGRQLNAFVQKFPIQDHDGNVAAVGTIFTDISERVRAEEDRRQALVQAEKASKVKSEFLAAMSHELRTPLNAILGFSEIIANQYMGPIEEEKYVGYASDIFKSSEHLLSLVNNILDLSTIEAGAKKITKVPTQVEDVVEECRRSMDVTAQNRKIELTSTFVTSGITQFDLDPLAIRQIILNLLTNALQATPDGGKICINCQLTDDVCEMSITDNGRGIPEEILDSLTLPFVRGETDPHRALGGAGLGLSIVKTMVDLHDGRMNISSELNKGTSVTITLPATP